MDSRGSGLSNASFFFFKMSVPSIQFKDEHSMAK